MAVAERELFPRSTDNAAKDVPQDVIRPWLCTFDQFQQMGEAGVFEGQRVELWKGEIIQMPAVSSHHRTSVTLTGQALRAVFGTLGFVSEQSPFHAAHNTDPEPDLAFYAGDPRDYAEAHPTQALLLVEVSLSTLPHDRVDKASLYAQAGIADYWIVNLEERQLEVYRIPAPDTAQPFGFGYADVQTYQTGQSVTPVAVPDVPVAVADLLP